jgi:hypothetical protein
MAERKPAEVIPNPDPSAITSEAIDRAVSNAVKVVDARIDGMEKAVEVFQADLTRVPTSVDRAILGLRELQEARFKAIEENLKGLHNAIEPIDCDIRKEISHLRALMDAGMEKLAAVTTERFAGVAAQFAERDTRTDQRAGDTKLAVDAAFAAAKEATAKIEAGFTKQIDGMVTIIDTKTSNLAGGLGDLKERLTAMESRTQGISTANAGNREQGRDNREQARDDRGFVFGVVGMMSAAVAIVLSVALHFLK